MDKVIELCYRKVITVSSAGEWERLVFESSYTEFRMQAQNFAAGTAYTSYGQLLKNVEQASQLPARILPAVNGYIKQLGNVVPDILNNVGRRFLRFDNYEFELINSDIKDKARHQVAVNFYARPLWWHATIGNLLLVAEVVDDVPIANTNLFSLPAYVNIQTIKSFK
ncbi:hypothetical protein [Mucilaginibacter sp. KACC 22063]|uniref:hypothetical protein n=1 Tax=Mucilaginibacter sp. KACC 22063 TaxID=3025666 RepID=UPI002365A499|nr:hypothetical protein [Mucilaginibacter sp. KACC 22063]WDF54192.1 hypothetical protein PQ461_14695 [Mucilaginibacter sp. KACC 22063]